jgi:hypothetical protein
MKNDWQFNHTGIKVVAFVSPMWNQANGVGDVIGERDASGAHYVTVKLREANPRRSRLTLQDAVEENIDQVILMDRGEFESTDPISQVESGWFKGLAYLPNLGKP